MRAALVTLAALALVACVPAARDDSRRMGGARFGGGSVGLDAGSIGDASPVFYLYATPDACAAAAAVVDQAQGYPSRGVDIGQGIHVGPDGGWTITYAPCLPSADGSAYAYPADTVSATAIGDAAPEAASITFNEAGTFGASAL
jgi:hypothetical protein